jgi:hypothetical protein
MGFHIVSGRPASGKTCLLLRSIVEELVKGKRLVLTNVRLDLDRLKIFLDVVYPKLAPIDLRSRIRFLDDEEVAEFWLYRHEGLIVQRGVIDSLTPVVFPHAEMATAGGCVYFLDEVQQWFGRSLSAVRGSRLFFYLSQSRCLGDEVFAVTQQEDSLHPTFLELAQDYTVMASEWRVERQRRFFYSVYACCGARRRAAKPFCTGNFRLDVEGLDLCVATSRLHV